mgnify:CR=1 FL=1
MPQNIYQPAEDSCLLSQTLEKYLNKLIVSNKHKSLSNRRFSNEQQPPILFHKVNDIKEISILDMGSGSGIQAETCKKLGFTNILTADINKEAVKELKQQGFKSIYSDLFSNIKKQQKFNLIIFNPPYLPENKYDKKPDTTAGKKGYELIIKFLKQARQHLNKNAVILLLFSSLSHSLIIKKQAKQLGYELKLLNKQKLFFEELFVYELKNN